MDDQVDASKQGRIAELDADEDVTLEEVEVSKDVDVQVRLEESYAKPSTKLTFYKALFSTQWKFLIHTILQCMSGKRTAWNEFSSSMASVVICLATGMDTPLFAGMLVPQQAQDVEDAAEAEDDANEVSNEPSPPLPKLKLHNHHLHHNNNLHKMLKSL
nr:ribonuclease H-like domain, reverse transcriptase, RNA-dependent DNA polymerase [Tanacetum cinerariifolium]